MTFDIDKWYKQKSQGDILHKYRGTVSQKQIIAALKTIEESLNIADENNKIRRKVFSVFVESIQNLFHHVENPPKKYGLELEDNFAIIILIREKSQHYRISTGNFIKTKKAHSLKDRIDQVNSMNEEEIRLLYREILENEKISAKGGGGLGILDIARKTGKKLEYYLYPFDDNYVFFTLDVFIS